MKNPVIEKRTKKMRTTIPIILALRVLVKLWSLLKSSREFDKMAFFVKVHASPPVHVLFIIFYQILSI